MSGLLSDPPLSFRFAVFFLAGGIVPNPLDIRFQKVSGLSADVRTRSYDEGGQNLYSHKLPERIEHGNLHLERGFVVGSILNVEFLATFSLFKFYPSNVLVTLLSEDKIPVAAWMFLRAYPVKWATSDLDADSTSLVIDTMELAYARMQPVRI